jgi:phosphoserine phosphatase RsbU/P
LTLAPGDALWFFTDGILEARAGKGQGMFGPERIRALVRECDASRSLAECTDAAKVATDRFTGSTELQDDLTLLALRRKSNS